MYRNPQALFTVLLTATTMAVIAPVSAAPAVITYAPPQQPRHESPTKSCLVCQYVVRQALLSRRAGDSWLVDRVCDQFPSTMDLQQSCRDYAAAVSRHADITSATDFCRETMDTCRSGEMIDVERTVQSTSAYVAAEDSVVTTEYQTLRLSDRDFTITDERVVEASRDATAADAAGGGQSAEGCQSEADALLLVAVGELDAADELVQAAAYAECPAWLPAEDEFDLWNHIVDGMMAYLTHAGTVATSCSFLLFPLALIVLVISVAVEWEEDDDGDCAQDNNMGEKSTCSVKRAITLDTKTGTANSVTTNWLALPDSEASAGLHQYSS